MHILLSHTYCSTFAKYFLFIHRKTWCCKLMFGDVVLVWTHFTTYRKCMLHTPMWHRLCKKIECHMGKNCKQILYIFAFPKSKAGVKSSQVNDVDRHRLQRAYMSVSFLKHYQWRNYVGSALRQTFHRRPHGIPKLKAYLAVPPGEPNLRYWTDQAMQQNTYHVRLFSC